MICCECYDNIAKNENDWKKKTRNINEKNIASENIPLEIAWLIFIAKYFTVTTNIWDSSVHSVKHYHISSVENGF